MGRRYRTNRIKKNRTYTTEELSEAVGVTPQTVRRWRKQGMQVIDGNRPALTMGFQALEFLKDNRPKKQGQMELDQFRCFTCREPKRPFEGLVEYHPISATHGRLWAFCETCGGSCPKVFSAKNLTALETLLRVPVSCTIDA